MGELITDSLFIYGWREVWKDEKHQRQGDVVPTVYEKLVVITGHGKEKLMFEKYHWQESQSGMAPCSQ